jgi:hypothetical protein
MVGLLEDQYTFLKIETILCLITFFKHRDFYYINVERYGTAREATGDNRTRLDN